MASIVPESTGSLVAVFGPFAENVSGAAWLGVESSAVGRRKPLSGPHDDEGYFQEPLIKSDRG